MIVGETMKRLTRFLREEDGATVVEYTVMLAMIVLVLLCSVALLGENSNGVWTTIQSSLTSSAALNPK